MSNPTLPCEKKTVLVALDRMDQLFSHLELLCGGPQHAVPDSVKNLLETYVYVVEHSLVLEVFLTEDAELKRIAQ